MIRNSRIAFTLATGVSAFALLSSAPVLAQDQAAGAGGKTASSTEKASSSSGLGEIVVTAERRTVNVQDAPISVSAVSADTLKANNITQITGLNGIVPGLVVAKGGGGERDISIRGIGSETPENTNTQPGVSYHINGAYIFNSIAATAAYIDVQRVEVLRGPQGTLFGQGSTGGTINVVTAPPVLGQWTGYLDGSIGNYNYYEGKGALNVPLGNTFALRGAFQFVKHDGYGYATQVPGYGRYGLDDEDNTSFRLGAKWAPTSNFSIQLNAINYNSKTHGPEQKNILDPAPNPRVVTQDYPGKDYIRTQLYTGVVTWRTPVAVIKSISSFQKLLSQQSWDADGLDPTLFSQATYIPAFYGGYAFDHVALWQSRTKSYTEELNLSSPSAGPFFWTAGAIYLHSKNSQYINEYKGFGSQNPFAPALPMDTQVGSNPLISQLTYAENSSVTREEYAFYAQVTYDVLPKLKLTGGVRYNHDKATGTFDAFSNGTPDQTSGAYLQPAPVPARNDHAWTGKAAAQYTFNPNHMAYASFTVGFKPGGTNANEANGGGALNLGFGIGVLPTYKQEKVYSYEIGTKNEFLNRTLQLNADAFFYNYKNMQFLNEDPVPFAQGISNVPDTHIWGAELQAAWLATPSLRFDASGSWLEGKVTSHFLALDPQAATAAQDAINLQTPYIYFAYPGSFFDGVAARAGAAEDLYGHRPPKLPRWQGTFAATYTHHIPSGMVTLRGQVIYRGSFESRIFNNPVSDNTPSYTQVNALVRYEPDHTNFDFSLRVTNLFDVTGVNARFSDPYGSNQVFTTYIAPRQVIASIGYKF